MAARFTIQAVATALLVRPKNAFITSDSLENVNGIVCPSTKKVMGHYHLENYFQLVVPDD